MTVQPHSASAEAVDPRDEALIGTLNDVQRACVTNVSGPLLVSAGAGSGKTFMLTRRIAYALLHPELSGVADVAQDVLAITFTELAAAEIKARVRSTLRSVGMVDAALKVDSSWISTIHGMCSRILHEHALELGLDPAFTLLDDTDRNRLLAESVGEAVAAVAFAPKAGGDGDAAPGDGGGPDGTAGPDDGARGDGAGSGFAATAAAGYGELFSEYGVEAVKDMVVRLIDEAASVQGGIEAIDCGPEPVAPQMIARDVYEAMVQMEGAAHLLGINAKGKQDAFATNTLDALRGSPNGIARFERLAADADTAYEDLAGALAAFNPKFAGRNLGKSAEKKAAYATWMLAYDRACSECVAGLAGKPTAELLALARAAQGVFDCKKEELGCLDQNDLLLRTLRAFRGNERIAREFRGKFKLVMVDEFQDTSALQIAIIEYLDGTNDEHLCTVGDTQQSIYRFRGADVDTYREHKRHMRTEVGADYRELGVNYRSHGDVITFVNRLFSQERAFGTGPNSEFIELAFNPQRPSGIPQGLPRIDVTFVVSRNSSAQQPAPVTADRRQVEARVVCDRFVAYHEAGVAWRDMVVLLGTMSHADDYAAELRAHGIPCVIAGGSIFDRAPEARAVCSLACAVANPLDDAALVDVLTSDMFCLDPDELLLASTDPAGRRRAHLWGGLLPFADAAPTPRLHLAAATLRCAVTHASRSGAAEVLTEAVIESGWFDRLYEAGPEGTAQAANIMKAIRLAEQLEGDPAHPRGIASVAQRMSTMFSEGMKEAPGALNVTGSDAVRIMTIHASKGLEFPVVALGEFWKAGVDRDTLQTETIGETIYAFLGPGRSLRPKIGRFGDLASRLLGTDDYLKWSALASETDGAIDPVDAGAAPDPADARDASAFRRAVKGHAKASELAELRRKFYVGATRPREALVIVCEAGQDKERITGSPEAEGSFGAGKELLEDLAQALYPSGAPLADAPEGIEFGGSMRAVCRKVQLEVDIPLLQQGGQRRVHVVGKPLSDYLLSDRLGGAAYRVEAAARSEAGDWGAPNPLANGPLLPATLEEYAHDYRVGGDGGSAVGTDALMRVPEPVDIHGLLPLQIPCNPLRAGTFSYSSIAHPGDAVGAEDQAELDPDELARAADPGLVMDDGSEEAALVNPVQPRRPGWFDPTSFGSAFHTAAQWMAERAIAAGADSPTLPDDARLEAIARTWGLAEDALPRLKTALRRWQTSPVAREAYARARLEPEAPFFVTLLGPQGEPLHLEGSIDLLCTEGGEPAGRRALVVDYKTGGSAQEDAQALHAKHLLQAQCYAYAVLLQGYAGVDLRFVRVEIEDAQNRCHPQVVSYAFEAADRDALETAIRSAYRASRK